MFGKSDYQSFSDMGHMPDMPYHSFRQNGS